MQQVKFRLVNPGLAPRRTKLEMPGWAGQPEPRTDGSQEYAWHCAPFAEGAQYGIEIFYPYDNELGVSRKNGKLAFDGDFGARPDNSGDLMWPPFRSFGRDYYTYQLLLDLKVGKDWAVRTEPHPRFYTDLTDTVPVAVPALLRTEWWPMISFVVFKSPVEGHTHIFRPGEPMLQILILPVTADFTLAAMDEEEARNAKCAGGVSTAAVLRLPPILPGRRAPTQCSTVRTGIYYARPKRAKANDARALLAACTPLPSPSCYFRHCRISSRLLLSANGIFPALHNGIVEPKRATRRSVERLQIGRRGDALFFPWHLDLRGTLCRARLDRNFR